MTRGTLFYYENDNEIYSSVEFNGDMYHDEEGSMGQVVIDLMKKGISNVDDFKKMVTIINKDYKYDDGNEIYLINDEAIGTDIKETIEWIETKRRDMIKTNNDPRTWDKTPTFKDVSTWQFWGMPNLSDYSYIYNNSNKELEIKTADNKPMIIPPNHIGVLCFGHFDCVIGG